MTITHAIASALPGRHGYTKLVYRLSAPVPSKWIAWFDDMGRARAGNRPYERSRVLTDRIEVLLPDRDHADRPALIAIKTYLEGAVETANRHYCALPQEVMAAEAREIGWQRRVLISLRAALDEQFSGTAGPHGCRDSSLTHEPLPG